MPVPTTTSQPSAAALYTKLDFLNEAIDALVDVLDKVMEGDEFLAPPSNLEGRRAAYKTISEAASQLQRQADGTFQEALDAAYAGR